MSDDPFISELPALKVGDHLLYTDGSLISWTIRLKTWSAVSHIEVYAGPASERDDVGKRFAYASRFGGVKTYPFRAAGLRFVLRPHQWDAASADLYARACTGQGYDWVGLFCFTLAVAQGAAHKQFCSEFARNLDRAASCPSFADNWPGDKTAPGDNLKSPAFDWIYHSDADYEVGPRQEDWRVA